MAVAIGIFEIGSANHRHENVVAAIKKKKKKKKKRTRISLKNGAWWALEAVNTLGIKRALDALVPNCEHFHTGKLSAC